MLQAFYIPKFLHYHDLMGYVYWNTGNLLYLYGYQRGVCTYVFKGNYGVHNFVCIAPLIVQAKQIPMTIERDDVVCKVKVFGLILLQIMY